MGSSHITIQNNTTMTYCGGVIGGKRCTYPNLNNLAGVSKPSNVIHAFDLVNMAQSDSPLQPDQYGSISYTSLIF
jgi:hypothetical protein